MIFLTVFSISSLNSGLESLLSERKIFSPSNLRAWKCQPFTASPHEMAYFSRFLRLIGRCAHGSLLACGRSSAPTTYFLNSYCLCCKNHSASFSFQKKFICFWPRFRIWITLIVFLTWQRCYFDSERTLNSIVY